MRIFIILLVIWVLAFPRLASSSQVRVDSAGGLSLVMTDETSDINPYNLGNPAGLVLLPPQMRFQTSLPWYSVTSESSSTSYQEYGISAAFSYEGLVDITKDWALQAGGSWDGGNSKWNSTPGPATFQDGAGLFRVAGSLEPLVIGSDVQLGAGSIDSNNESSNSSVLSSTTGLLANIPLANDDHPVLLRVGGSFFFVPGPQQTSYFFTSNSASVTETYATSTNSWKPCLFLDIPETLQVGIITGFNNSSGTETTGSSNSSLVPDVPTHTIEDDSSFYLNAVYKWEVLLSPPEGLHPLHFNNGLRFEMTDNHSTQFQQAGSISLTSQQLSTRLQAGIGLEGEKDFMVGIQGHLFTVMTAETSTGLPTINRTFSLNQVSIGGEKWISSHWALRLGFMYEDANNPTVSGNGSSAWEGYYQIYPGQNIQGVRATIGAGYDDKLFKADGRFWFEQPQPSGQGVTGPDYTNTLFGAELSVALFLN